MRFLGVDPEKGPRLEWCCEEAHQAYLDHALDYEASEDRFCVYGIPPYNARDRANSSKHYLHPIDLCPFCGAMCETESNSEL